MATGQARRRLKYCTSATMRVAPALTSTLPLMLVCPSRASISSGTFVFSANGVP
ncbi:hypothetical protein ACEZHJ_00045 [Arhodomonas sp. KWT2]|uniref:hypothetical protein n=1 Tax=Arhodomonas sp. KWT2 TaxID=3344194 RepID=UPI0035BF9A89